jgi:hypothetical protein
LDDPIQLSQPSTSK